MTVNAYRRYGVSFVDDYGSTTISGIVKELTVPVSRPAYLLRQENLKLIRATVSANDGTYSFPNMEENAQYIVMSIDTSGAYNAVVADRVGDAPVAVVRQATT